MIAHTNGQTINYSSFSKSLGVSNTTIRNYIDLLRGTFMVEAIPPYHKNFGKRIVKAPKVYISDTGIAARLLNLRGFNQISGHPSFGSMWEGMVLANIRGHMPATDISFFRTSNGAEIDFIVESGRKVYAIECKSSLTPRLNKGNRYALQAIKPDNTFIVAPIEKGWSVEKGVEVVSPEKLVLRMMEGE